jgi:CTD kinase subunit beta
MLSLYITPADLMPSQPVTDPPLEFNPETVGPHPGFIEPCRSYIFENDIQQSLKLLKTERKDEAWRMKGVRFLLDAKNVLQLWVAVLSMRCRLTYSRPLKTFDTAAVIFHRFRLQHSMDDYQLLVRVA